MSTGPWRDRRVRVFLAAEAASAIGTWATIVAIWGYAAFEFDASAGDVALFGVAFSLPPVLLGPISGTVIDRIGPKATLAGAKLLGAAASLALLAADDFRSLAVLSALHGAGAAFALPALQSMPPRIVGPEHLARTNALVALCDELAIVLGPVAAGLSIAWFGFHGAFIFDAATYLLGLVVLPLVRVRAPVGSDGAPPARLRYAFAGWALVARTPSLRRTVAAVGAVNLLYGAALLAEPLYVRDVLERSPAVFASLQTVFGVCLVAGGVIVARLEDRVTTFGWVVLAVGASGVSAVLYLGTPFIAVAFAGVALWGWWTALLAGPSRTLLQRHAHESYHGRVLATDQVVGSGAQLLGIATAGLAVGVVGVPLAIGAIAGVVIVVSVLLHRDERRGRAPAPDGPAEPIIGPPVVGAAPS